MVTSVFEISQRIRSYVLFDIMKDLYNLERELPPPIDRYKISLLSYGKVVVIRSLF